MRPGIEPLGWFPAAGCCASHCLIKSRSFRKDWKALSMASCFSPMLVHLASTSARISWESTPIAVTRSSRACSLASIGHSEGADCRAGLASGSSSVSATMRGEDVFLRLDGQDWLPGSWACEEVKPLGQIGLGIRRLEFLLVGPARRHWPWPGRAGALIMAGFDGYRGLRPLRELQGVCGVLDLAERW